MWGRGGARAHPRIAPSRWTPMTSIDVQQLGLPQRHATHEPHSQYGTTATLSPFLRPESSQPGPRATTVAPISWPSTRGYTKKFWQPSKAW